MTGSSHTHVTVKDSPIHGKGIFALKCFAPDEEILIITGEAISEGECIRRENEEENVYIFWNGDSYIDTAMTVTIRYINHDCAPNCYVADHSETTLLLMALRDIPEGEELTIDYGYEEIYQHCTCATCTGKNR